MRPTAAEVDQLTEKIIGCAIQVHRSFGPGLLESVYRECLIVEIKNQGMRVESERRVQLDYKGQRINSELLTPDELQ